jgi:hypothetical protein
MILEIDERMNGWMDGINCNAFIFFEKLKKLEDIFDIEQYEVCEKSAPGHILKIN